LHFACTLHRRVVSTEAERPAFALAFKPATNPPRKRVPCTPYSQRKRHSERSEESLYLHFARTPTDASPDSSEETSTHQPHKSHFQFRSIVHTRYTLYNLPTIFHPELHTLFETLGYFSGYWFYKRERAKQGDILDEERRWSVIAAAAVGGLIGSRFLGVLEELPRSSFHWQQFFAVTGGGKTIVGGLLGGWIGVEFVKKISGIRSRTGDLFVVPLCIGIAIGRIGCFLAGLADDTYGTPTSLPWGVDFGDGIPRHPTQLYEVIFLTILAVILYHWNARPHREGIIFRAFMAAYLAWRFLVDFIKPQPLTHGMNMIQWACIAGLVVLAVAEIGSKPEADYV
jgi:phosphatidylglycerol:prolipoprotein diacylglycerol transferase